MDTLSVSIAVIFLLLSQPSPSNGQQRARVSPHDTINATIDGDEIKIVTGDTPATNTLERSTTFVDHTFVKGNSDNSYPAATYTVAGNNVCP
jgi:hypothetical protein